MWGRSKRKKQKRESRGRKKKRRRGKEVDTEEEKLLDGRGRSVIRKKYEKVRIKRA